MPRNMTPRDLARITPHVKEVLGEYWDVRVYSAAEAAAENVYDPPVAYVRVECALGAFDVTADGEWYLDSPKTSRNGRMRRGRGQFKRVVDEWKQLLGEV